MVSMDAVLEIIDGQHRPSIGNNQWSVAIKFYRNVGKTEKFLIHERKLGQIEENREVNIIPCDKGKLDSFNVNVPVGIILV